MALFLALTALATGGEATLGALEAHPPVVSPSDSVATADRTITVTLTDPDLGVPGVFTEMLGAGNGFPEGSPTAGQTFTVILTANPVGRVGGVPVTPIGDLDGDGDIDRNDVVIVSGDLATVIAVTAIHAEFGTVTFNVGLVTPAVTAAFAAGGFEVRFASPITPLARGPHAFSETLAAPGDLVGGEAFTLDLNMDWLPLQDSNGDGLVDTGDILVSTSGRDPADTPVVTDIGLTGFLADPATGQASGDRIILEHRGEPLAAGTEIMVTYLGLRDLVSVRGSNGVDIPLRIGGTVFFRTTVILTDGRDGRPDEPRDNLNPGGADRPQIAAVHGGEVTFTYADQSPEQEVAFAVQARLVEADFGGAPPQGFGPLSVSFLDRSRGATTEITSWEWDFGDGNTSTGQNPAHVYQDPGAYDVSLTVMAGDVTVTETREGYIEVFPDLRGQRFSEFPVEVLNEQIQLTELPACTGLGLVDLEPWDRVEVQVTLHGGDPRRLTLGFPVHEPQGKRMTP